ncbi:putative 3,4-dihydroxy-2-butanone kinase [Acorus calamus]|uniref:3,4-dihydroxy-2-butanone kinase n=1 Tax=Acorus calamus TaxID=4465 RepID=A0AAV9CVR6_ACOCL|nr:putative 3,4-dihydroxy-2-butanone kinase [Acorus calamus]
MPFYENEKLGILVILHGGTSNQGGGNNRTPERIRKDVVTKFIEGMVETYPGLQNLDGFPRTKEEENLADPFKAYSEEGKKKEHSLSYREHSLLCDTNKAKELGLAQD